MSTLDSVATLRVDIERGDVRATELLERCLEAVAEGEGPRAFIHVTEDRAYEEAQEVDDGARTGPLAGIPISVKDNVAVRGLPTSAGSPVLAEGPPAERDALALARLSAAGAVLVGRTNMTELAFSGVGLNPHYGTPLCPWDRETGRIPGGSSAGAAVACADGMCAASIGSDTGGSVRIPAALCGLVGFRPTYGRVPIDDVVPLAAPIDALGPLTPDVASCAIVDDVMAGGSGDVPRPLEPRELTFLVPSGHVVSMLDPEVADAIERAKDALRSAGATLTNAPHEVEEMLAMAHEASQSLAVGAEAYRSFRALIEDSPQRMDPRVARGLAYCGQVTDQELTRYYADRKRHQDRTAGLTDGVHAILMPTVPSIPAPLAILEDDDEVYLTENNRLLQNTELVNALDRPALSIPCHAAGDAPTSLMLVGTRGQDRALFACGLAVERVLAGA